MSVALDVFASLCAPVPAADFIAALLRTGFSPEAYRDTYGDLRERGMDATEALAHYLRHGAQERRHVPLALDRRALVDLARLPVADVDFKAQLLTSLAGQLFEDVGHPYGDAIAGRWPVVQALAHQRARPFLVAGDSHSLQLAAIGARSGDWLLPIHMLCHAGSARGLGNPASRSRYGEHLRQAVRAIRALPGAPELPFLMQFGQVDIEFVHHFHRVRDGQRVLDIGEYRAFCATTIERYIAFATDLFNPVHRRNVFLLSVFPPAMSDDAWRHGHLNDDIVRRQSAMSREQLSAGVRDLEIAGLAERTAIHAHYNALLRTACAEHGFRYVDAFTRFLGPDGVVDRRYVVPESHGFEHHLDSRRTYDVLSDMVWDIVNRSTGRM